MVCGVRVCRQLEKGFREEAWAVVLYFCLGAFQKVSDGNDRISSRDVGGIVAINSIQAMQQHFRNRTAASLTGG